MRILAGVVFATACGQALDSPRQVPPRLLLAVSPAGSDTIQSPVVRHLTVTVYDSSGGTAAGIAVRATSSAGLLGPLVMLGDQPVPRPQSDLAQAATDPNGHADIYFTAGFTAGTHYVRVTAASLRLLDSVPVTILPGNPAAITVGPADTALYVGSSFSPLIAVKDRAGNASNVPATITNLRPDVATLESGLLTAKALGRGRSRLTAAEVTADAWVSVVPPATLVVYRAVLDANAVGLYTVQMDGSRLRKLGVSGGAPRWSPSGDRIAYFAYDRIFTADTLGAATQLLPASYGISAEIQPQYSRDGAWIYYSASPGYDRFEIWRARSDGTAPSRVGPAADVYNHDTSPTPSPDGTKFAYATNRVLGSGGLVLQVVDVATGAVTPINTPGRLPRWAPNSQRIAYLQAGHVGIVNADGTSNRLLLGLAYDDNYGSVDWSPDEQWLIACATTNIGGDRQLVLINVASGEELPLPYSKPLNLCASSWKA